MNKLRNQLIEQVRNTNLVRFLESFMEMRQVKNVEIHGEQITEFFQDLYGIEKGKFTPHQQGESK